jgi:hypothetical protein
VFPAKTGTNRREFLARVGGGAAIGSLIPPLAASTAASGRDDEIGGHRRANEALLRRRKAALLQWRQGVAQQVANGDERRYASRIGSFSKALPHDQYDEVDRDAYDLLVRARTSGDPTDFDAIPLGGVARLVNPQGGLAFGFVGADSHALGIRTPPAFASAEEAGEMVELYWQALTRDVPFADYGSDPAIAAAAVELSRLSDFRGPKAGGAVTPATIFRGPTAGDLVGPYVSQLLWKPVNYGPYVIDQKVRIPQPDLEYMTEYESWRSIQNGGAPVPKQYIDDTSRRYIITARDLTEWVHRDFTHQGGTNAVFILLASGVPLAPGNPYRALANQAGFVTFGPPQILDLVATVANLALCACWFQKWSVHRRLRPEEFGGAIRNRLVLGRPHPIHADVLQSAALREVQTRYGSALLPMAYPEGCPVHPAYPAGHATFAGACVTVLKAFFDTTAPIQNPVIPDATGDNLLPYTGEMLTAGNELDKLASNISISRDAAGVHWRTDGEQGMFLGEQAAIRMLQDVRRSFNESFDGFSFTRFDGTPVTI